MTHVTCSNIDCIHCNQSNFLCEMDVIQLGEEFFAGCDTYKNYRETKEYSEKYCICVKTKDGCRAKAQRLGKRIEYKDKVFFTHERVNDDGTYGVTEEEPGLYAGEYRQLEERYDRICEQIRNEAKVIDLPLAEKVDNGYVIVASEKENQI